LVAGSGIEPLTSGL